MSRYLFTLHSTTDRLRAVQTIEAAPAGSRVEVKAAKRTLPQNDRMWAMLTEIARQLPWHGQTLRPDDWKLLFLDALKRELRNVPNLAGTGFVNINQSSSDLTKSEMSDLIELMHQFGAEHGVKFADDARAA
jgi:NinB protein